MSLRILVLSVGSPKHRGMAESVRDYEARAGRYFSLESIEVQARRSGGDDPARVRRDEAEALLRRLPPNLETFALTRHGLPIDTRGLAERLEQVATYGPAGVAFLVGGPFGLHDDLIQKCRHRLSLSALTLPHELARLVLAEQLYRVGTLLRGEPYHKGS